MVSCLLLAVACVSVMAGLCPLTEATETITTHSGSVFLPQLCNVSFISPSPLCACFGNSHCSGGCGCLVPAGSCTAGSCGFPRLCFCELIKGVASNGANCSPVNRGPCKLCPSISPLVKGPAVATPAKVLHAEFAGLTTSALDARLEKLRLPPAASASREEKIRTLVAYVQAQELAA